MISARARVIACVGAGLLLRWSFGLFYWVDRPLTHDEREYLALARSVARGDGFVYPDDEPLAGTGQRFGRVPGYPLFLAGLGIRNPVDAVPRRVKVAQAVVGAIGVWLIASSARRAAGDRAGIAAAAIAAVYPPLIFMPAYALSETLYSTVALAAVWALERGTLTLPKPRQTSGTVTVPVPTRGPGRGTVTVLAGGSVSVPLLASILTGAATLIRPVTLFFLPLVTLWLWRHNRRRAILFLLLTLACIAPWTIRNALAYHRFIPLASEGGVTFWTGNHPLARGDGDLASNLPLKQAELAFRQAHPDLTPEQLEPYYYRDAFAWMWRHPARWLALDARKLFYTVVPIGPSYTLHSTRYYLASAIPYAVLVVPAVVGGLRLRHRSNPPMALWLLAASTVIAALVFFPQERFRIPAIDPALIVSAAALAAPGTDERTRRRPDV